MGFLNGVIKALGLDPNDRAVAKYEKRTEIIDSLEPEVEKLSDEELARSVKFSARRLERRERRRHTARGFRRVREVSKRTLGLRHFKEQIHEACVNDGNIAEMKTGEGKTLKPQSRTRRVITERWKGHTGKTTNTSTRRISSIH